MDWIDAAKTVFEREINAAEQTKNSLGNSFCEICEAVDQCPGHVILTGMGKSGHICKKVTATMQSLGIKAFYLHPGEALHGDLGMLNATDILLAISNSGETAEILSILPNIQQIGLPVYSIVGRPKSSLEDYSSACLVLPPFPEAYLDNIVPTSSTTVALIIGDAIAVSVARKRGFGKKDFSLFHPSGLLGKRLTLRVDDLMLKGNENPTVSVDATVRDAVFEMCRRGIGGINIVSNDGLLRGVFTDGDLRRMHNEIGSVIDNKPITEVMTSNPIVVYSHQLVANVVENIKRAERRISFFPVVDGNGVLVGSLRLIDITKSGLL